MKIKMVGDSGVGKTSIIMRYAEGTFSDTTAPTIGVDYKNAMITIGGKKIKLVIWDTAGQERYRTLTSAYYKGTNALCVVFDVSSRESFESLDKWLKEFYDNAGEGDAVQMMLIANKIDLAERKVTGEEAEAYAKKNMMLYVETSAKVDKGVKQAFVELATKVLENNPAIIGHNRTPGGPQGSTKLSEQRSSAGKQEPTCCA